MTYNDSCAIRHTCTMITIKDMEQDEDIEPLKAKLLELKDAPQELEDGGQATVDKLIEINLGNEEDRRPTYISALLPEEDQDVLKALLMEYKDCFAWTYKEMPGLDPSVAVHKLAISPDVAPVKQAPRRTRVDLEEQIITETKKLIEAGFIREEKYADWITSIVPVKKKNGQIRICVDFRDLNKACPKDDFPLPVTELMIDNTSSYEMFSFMDGSSGYNQIKMAPEDEKHTAFRTPIGIYCYKVMPFGLKNAGATYQRAMTIIFDDLLHKVVECYVDDLVVKTVNKANHFEDLRTVFTRLKKYNLKMNPLKCAFGVYSGKFLGFIVRHRGIEIDPAKIKAIMELPPPKNLKQLRSFQGRLAYIRRFISNLSGRIKPFSKLVKKDAPFIWDDDCQTAFDDIKKYLLSPPVLAAPIHGRPLILYTAALEGSLGALLAQNNEEGKESALYYLSRMLVGAENFYSPIEKHCLALIFAVKKLRHYMLEHKIHLISRVDPLKFLMTRPVLTGRLAKWAVILLEFDITYVPQKAIKGQALTDFLAAHPIPDDSPLVCDLPDEHIMFATDDQPYWKMYFDGASSIQPAFSPNIPKIKAGIALIFVTPEGGILRYSLALSEPRTNNEAEYEALIAGLEIAIQLNIQKLHIFGDSQLIINQVEGEFKIHKPELVEYQTRVKYLMEKIPYVKIEKVSRAVNGKADALARLAKELADPTMDEVQITIRNRKILSPADLNPEKDTKEAEVATIDIEDDWREPFIDFLKYNKLPEEKSRQAQIKKRAMRYVFVNDQLYRRSYDQLWLKCLSPNEIKQVMHEVHSGVCGAHQSGPKMRLKIKHLGYYWPTMIQDCMMYARKCHQCQIHGDFIHRHPNPLHPTIASWPFDMWGTDVIGPINPLSSRGHKFILAATDYFSRWVEAIPLREVKADDVVKFFKENILYRFGVPRRIISDNGTAFRSFKVNRFATQHKIDWRYSSIYNARANGLAEAFNKTLTKLLKKIIGKNQKEWHMRIIEALWAYRTTYRTPTQATPYSLVFGVEAVLPLEVELPSLRIAVQHELTNEENALLRLDELDALDEVRLTAQQNLELYQAQMASAYNKLTRYRTISVGELVLVLRRPIIINKHTGKKFDPNWEGPYVVEKAYEGGAYQLIDAKGERPMPPINGRFLKKYYV
ncbi:uncharacterized protein LOC109705053 [Ananas comosus]|uniref:Uncharacterized protein LOC109705053 n=1 Tax=Ananas comosus TaxID=4615 RepID=A0A6P5EJ10_ANACO|nr:uncharacterized protein LOC109705053 [Ananas comosus]